MLVPVLLYATVLGLSLPSAAAAKQSSTLISPTSANCTADSTPCGPAPACCDPGLVCNYRRGIPICTNLQVHSIAAFDLYPCADPYLFRCDVYLEIPGFCCPIGTSCFNEGNNDVINCVNALGTTMPAFPSATTGLIPSATPVSSSDTGIVYSPSQAWNISTVDSNCSVSKSLHVTSTINATISFNYTGPSIMVHTLTSLNGGKFSVLVDGLNTTSEIDTYSGYGGSEPLPTCYPVQFPPFGVTPPDYQYRENHTISLVYIGPSPLAPEGNDTSFIQFDSFAVPDLESVLAQTSNHAVEIFKVRTLHFAIAFILSMYAMY